MSKIIFASGFKTDLTAFLDHKRKTGFPYRSGAYYLADFDRYCSKNYPDCNQLTRHICLSWAVKRQSENASGFVSRVTPLRQFGKYLTSSGFDAYILPDQLGSHVSRPKPYIFNTADLKSFFDATDNMERYYQSVIRHFIAPIMFRYLYCCGLRPCEVRNILRKDANLETGKLFIRESKDRRERIVILPVELLTLTNAYLCKINAIYPESDFMFPNRYGKYMTYENQEYLFDICLTKSNIFSSQKPTLYSFRHSYATHRLYTWMKEGQDISAKLPYLCAFMGHSSFVSTAYYIHLIPEVFQEMSGIDMSQFEELIPEVVPE